MNNIKKKKSHMRNKNNKKEENKINKFRLFTLKFFIILLIFTFGTLLVKKDTKAKTIIYNNVYSKNISFAYFKSLYNKYIGSIIPFQDMFKTKKVFNEKLEYESLSKYNKGVKLHLKDNYAIPIIKGGIVIFAGEKEELGTTIIIQQSDGIDAWYSNLSSTTMKLYDYVSDNAIVGEAKNNELYLTFQKDGVEIDSSEVLK